MSAAPKTSAAGLAPEEFQAVAALLGRAGSRFESKVSGSSMAPTIPDESRIRIGPPPSGEYREGDIVACVVGDSLCTHRIVFRDPASRTVLTRGDGWILCDPPTPAERIVGAVCEYQRDGEWRPPGLAPELNGWKAAVASVSYWLVRCSLPVHPEVSRRVSGTMLGIGSGDGIGPVRDR